MSQAQAESPSGIPGRPIVDSWGVFGAAVLLSLAFALCTNHAWEDYYITFKTSKNLATGHGLVYHLGERVHTFTSPLGVLLPALSYLLTFNSSDDAALWIFRGFSILAYAGGVTLIYNTARAARFHRLATLMMISWLLTDSKSLDFTINGMETGLLLLFLAYFLWSLFGSTEKRRWLHLGLAWAGLMWTRPDGCIYIAGLSLAAVLAGGYGQGGQKRFAWLQTLARATAVCTVLYLPWFVFAWCYYGSPVPHTVVAKAAEGDARSLGEAARYFFTLWYHTWQGRPEMNALLTPAHQHFGGWPHAAIVAGRLIGSLAMLLWVVPMVRWQARVASLGCYVMMAYLGYYPSVLASWYFPGPTWLALFALGAVLSQLMEEAPKYRLVPEIGVPLRLASCAGLALGIAILTLGSWFTVEYAKEAAVQQRVIDGGNRTAIGKWLKENAEPHDRVFMECLGYIGYYSGIKTLDYPGLSSPEVVGAMKEVGNDWSKIIAQLKPEWLVLRPNEVIDIFQSHSISGVQYQFVRLFDVSSELESHPVYGSGVLAYDSNFLIFKRSSS